MGEKLRCEDGKRRSCQEVSSLHTGSREKGISEDTGQTYGGGGGVLCLSGHLSLLTVMKQTLDHTNSTTPPQGGLEGRRNLGCLQLDAIKDINMFNHLPARSSLYELCWCC